VTNVVQTWPEMVQQTNTSGFQVLSSPGYNAFESKQLAVFVHGWRMTAWDWEDFSDLMFKRLYWQGYQGRFASLRWPTRSQDTDTNFLFGSIPSDLITFDRSEYIAFESGTGAAAYFNNLRQRFTNDIISVCAHSMGNIVMMEALKELAASNQTPLDNYVMMQAAVSASCYDTTLPSLSKFTDQEQRIATPNTYSGYGGGIDNALRGAIINFFNTNDYALATASTNVSIPIFGGYRISTTIGLSWEDDQLLTKPLFLFGYSYNSTNSTACLTNTTYGITGRTVTDPRELMPFVARTRTKAVGAQPGVGQMVNGGGLDLSPFGFTDQSFDHSGQFNRNIQMPQVQQFYTNLVLRLFP
jgi:pimeloyl-ACP methyl ester carboxylesterase